MSRAPKPAPVKDEPALPTSPRPTDANGYALGQDGLPLSGPARLRMLAERADAQPSAATPEIEPAQEA